MTNQKRQKYMALAALALGILAIIAIYFYPGIGTIVKVVLAVVVLFLCGLGMQRSLSLKGGYGLVLLGGNHGMKTIEYLSKGKGDFWEQFALWGLTIGLGVSTYFLLKGRIKKSTYIIGLLSLVLIMFFIYPVISYGALLIGNIPNLPGGGSFFGQQIPLNGFSLPQTPLQAFPYVLIFLLGFGGFTFVFLIYYSFSILSSLASFASNPTAAGAVSSGITSDIPGVAPLLPGVTLPFIPGIIALALLLIVHEFSHGVLARRAKVKLKSIGILLFGFIPIGGFVEPDEKMVKKLNAQKQTGIFSAGIAANFLAMIVFFIITIIIANYIMPPLYSPGITVVSTVQGYPAYNVIPTGTVITKWNGIEILNASSLASAKDTDLPNSTVNLVTSTGDYQLRAVADPAAPSIGLIGIDVAYQPVQTIPAKIAYFLLEVAALSMLLNFLVAVVNLLPIFGFDGWRIYLANIKNARLINTVCWLLIILLVLNAVPWLFHI